MEERHRKPARPIGEQSKVVAVADFSPFLVVDPLEHLGRRAGWGIVRSVRAIPRLCPEKVITEWDRRIELQSVGLGAERRRKRIHRRGGRSRASEQRAAI